MMWHWNSLWAPAPGDPPAIDDPSLWRGPWTAEQTIALQARSWEAMVTTAHSWWALMLSAWPMGGTLGSTWPTPAFGLASGERAATVGAEPLLAAPATVDTLPTPSKPAARKRTTSAARKR